jgi:hypothetical protein
MSAGEEMTGPGGLRARWPPRNPAREPVAEPRQAGIYADMELCHRPERGPGRSWSWAGRRGGGTRGGVRWRARPGQYAGQALVLWGFLEREDPG